MNTNKFIPLNDLIVYQLSRQLSAKAWNIYSNLTYEHKKIIGDQFITATDSVGANIAEGYARFHYRDKIRFYHFSRASLSEAINHWAELMEERNIINSQTFKHLKEIHSVLEVKLNNFISVTLKNANNK